MAIRTPKQLEALLVSMAGTLIYLHDMAATLAKKPLIPKAVEADMAATGKELDILRMQFQAARQTALQDIQPLLDDWLRQVDLQVGGMFRARTHRAYHSGPELMVTGGIEHAQLHHLMVMGVRVVDIKLIGAQIRMPDGRTIAKVSDIAVRDQENYNLTALREVETKDPVSGATSTCLHVRVALQADQRSQWTRSGNLELL